MITYIITFIAVFLTDVLYIYFVKAIQHDKHWQASFWSVVVTFTASITVINYTEDHYNLIPALLGAFFGTLLGMKLRKKFGV
jgi:Na+/melibiose symporter-like transporter